MPSFAIYDQNGKVLRRGRGPVRAASIGLQEGESVFEGEVNPTTHFLPGGVPTPLPPPVVVIEVADVKKFMAKLLAYTDGYVMRKADTGQELPEAVQAYRDAVRVRAHEIEAMSPIPPDFRDAKYWPDQL